MKSDEFNQLVKVYRNFVKTNYIAKDKVHRDGSDEEFELKWNDKGKFCLTLQEYTGKGIFVMNNPITNTKVVGLREIVHIFKRKELCYPFTLRDILGKYLDNVSIFEESGDTMNLKTDTKVRISVDDPCIKLFTKSPNRMVTLYLQDKNYLNKDSSAEITLEWTRKDYFIVIVCVILLGITCIFMKYLIEYEPNM